MAEATLAHNRGTWAIKNKNQDKIKLAEIEIAKFIRDWAEMCTSKIQT